MGGCERPSDWSGGADTMTGVKFGAFDYTPDYLEDFPIEYADAIELLRMTLAYSDPSVLMDASRAMSADVLEEITQPIDESADKPGRESGRVVSQRGISVSDDKPRYQRSIAAFGGLFFETPFGFHRIFKPGDQPGPFGQKRRAFLLWDISGSNCNTLSRYRRSKPSIHGGENLGSNDSYERFNAGQLAMLMLLSDAIQHDVLVSTYIFPSQSARNTFQRMNLKSDEVEYPSPKNPSETKTKDAVRGANWKTRGYAPSAHWVDEDPEKVLNEVGGMRHLSTFPGNKGVMEEAGSAYLKLYDDLTSSSKRGDEAAIMITDADTVGVFSRQYSYGEWAWLTYFINQRADFYVVNLTSTPGVSHCWYAVYPGEMHDNFGMLGKTSPSCREEAREWLTRERGISNVTEGVIDGSMNEYLHSKVLERARQLAWDNGVGSKMDDVDGPDDLVKEDLTSRLIKKEVDMSEEAFGSSSRLRRMSTMKVFRHPYCIAAEEVLFDYMHDHLAVEKKIEEILRDKYDLPGDMEPWAIRDTLSDEWEELLHDYDAHEDWDLDLIKDSIGKHQVNHNIRVRYKELYINYFRVDDTNASAVLKGLRDLKPTQEMNTSLTEDLRRHTLTDQERKEWENWLAQEAKK